MDRKAANNLMVGAIVTVGSLAFLFILFNIGGGTGLLSSQYELYGKFKDVKGLHSGSEVSLSGLRVGVVKEITIATDDSKDLIVEFSIVKRFQDRIRKDSLATIRTQGVLGDKYIEISIGSPEHPVLESGSFIETDEVEDLFTRSGKLVKNIDQRFSEGGEIVSLIKNLDILTQNLATITGDIKRKRGLLNAMIYGNTGPKLTNSLTHLEGILAKINTGQGSLGALINDPTIYEDLKSLFGGAKRSNVLKYFLRQFVDEGKEEKKERQSD